LTFFKHSVYFNSINKQHVHYQDGQILITQYSHNAQSIMQCFVSFSVQFFIVFLFQFSFPSLFMISVSVSLK